MSVPAADRRVRYRALALVCLGVFAALFARLWYLQVLNAPVYEDVAVATSTRTVRIPAPRGRILDRHGKVIVDNVPTKVVAIDRQELEDAPEPDAVVSRVAQLLNHFEKPETEFTADSIRRDLEVNRVGPFDPVPLAENVSDELLVELVEHAEDYPGVVAETRLLRQYHYGALAAHILGRVGAIPEEQWEAAEDSEHPYAKDAQVGLSGLEQTLEEHLRGVDGERVVEVTPSGRVVRTVETTHPVPGDDVELTIDIDAQAHTERALADQVKIARETPTRQGHPPVPGGSAVLMEHGTGQVVAMASYPTYDPRVFVPAISEADWRALQDPDAHSPLTNRADAGLYSPGSTFKLVTALAGLRAGIIGPHTTYVDNGFIEVGGQRFTNDSGGGALGPIQLPRALTSSSNVYFFDIGEKLWNGRGTHGEEALQEVADDLGFGALSGIDLPDEKAVPMPTPERRRKLVEEYPDDYQEPNWYTGDNLNLAIGQDMLATPLQLANAYAQFANGGDRFRPTLWLRVVKPFAELDEDGVPVDPDDIVEENTADRIGHIDLPPEWHEAMLEGFSGVTQNPQGTAFEVFDGFPFERFPIAGKTGTTQTGKDETGKTKFSTAFFVGFGPVRDTGYVGVAVLEEAGYGSSAAAPVVRSMMEPLASSRGYASTEPEVPVAPPPPEKTAERSTTTTSAPEDPSARDARQGPEPALGTDEQAVADPGIAGDVTVGGP